MGREAAASGLGVHAHHRDAVVRLRRHQVKVGIEGRIPEHLLRPLVEEIAPHVGIGIAAPVPVDHPHLGSAAGVESFDHGVDVRREHLLASGILLLAEIEGLRVALARESLHVVEHQDAYPVGGVRGDGFQRPRLGRRGGGCLVGGRRRGSRRAGDQQEEDGLGSCMHQTLGVNLIAMIPTELECYARSAVHDRAGATRRWPGRGVRATLIGVILVVGAASTQAQQAFPYRFRAGWDVAFAAGGLAMFATDIIVTKDVEPFTPEQVQALDPQRVSGFDRFATRKYSTVARKASDVLLWSMLAAPLALMATSPGNEEPLLIGAMYGEALLFQSGLVFMLKSLVARTRPFVYNDNPAIPPEAKLIVYARRSFPSAHAATSFTSAVFLGTVYSKLNPGSSASPWIWAGGLAAAGLTGTFRTLGGQHFATDVLAGAAIGALTGWLVPALHRQEKTDDGTAPEARVSIPLLTLSFGRQSRNR